MKKIISLILIAVLLFSFVAVYAEETSEEAVLSEEIQMGLKEEFKLLSVLGLDLDFSKAYSEMTRAELAELAIKMGGFEILENGTAQFSDVPRRHWGFTSVSTIVANGCMSGKTEFLFEPEAKATVADGLRVMLGFLGYGSVAQKNSWTDGMCIQNARQAGILKGISPDFTGNITPYLMAKMFTRTLELSVVEVESLTEEGVLYKVDKDTKYITKRFGCYLEKGTVCGADDFALHSYGAPGKNKIRIDDKVFFSGNIDCIGFVGDKVNYITDGEDSEAELIYIAPKGDNEALEIDADSIIDYKKYDLSYFEDDEVKNVRVSQNCRIVLNGSEASKYDERDFMPLAGGITLKDSDDDGSYDLVFITHVIYYHVAAANEDGFITDSLTGASTKLDGSEITCVSDGKITDFESVKNDMVVGVMPDKIVYDEEGFPTADNKNLEKVKLDITSGTIKGIVNVCSSDGCVIGDEEYTYSAYFKKMAEKYNCYPKISSGTTAYLDETGRITVMKNQSKFTTADSGIKYGYLLGIGRKKGISANYTFKMIVDTATEQILEAADTFYMNNDRNPETLENIVGLYVSGQVVPQLVAYTLDANGKIKNMYTARDRVNEKILDLNGEEIVNPDLGSENYPGYDTENFALNYTASSARYRAGFMHRYIVADTAVVYIVPQDVENTKLFKVTNKSYFKIGGKYPISVYDVDENYFIHSLVIDGAKGSTASLERSLYDGVVSYIIDGKAKTLFNDEVRDVLKAKTSVISSLTFSDYAEAMLVTEAENMVHSSSDYHKLYAGTAWDELVCGDIIQLAKNEMGEVGDFRAIFRYKDLYNPDGSVKCQELINAGSLDAEVYNTVGVVTKILTDGSVVYNVDPEGKSSGIRLAREKGLERSYNRGMVRVFIFNSDKNTVTTGRLSDVEIGDAVVVRSEYGTACEMFVYR